MAESQQLCFFVESGTDVRLVDGLAEHFTLTVVARRIPTGVEISRVPSKSVEIVVGPVGRLSFAMHILRLLLVGRKRYDRVLVQGYGLAALAVNLAGRLRKLPTIMLVCSPVEKYYRCRASYPTQGKPFRPLALRALQFLAWLNGIVGRRYVTLSKHLEQVVRDHGTRLPIHVVPLYGVDTQTFCPTSRPKRQIREDLGLPTEGRLVFFSSRVAPEKDAETLVAAFGMLLRQGRDLWLLHRSGGFRDFMEVARTHNVDHRVVATDAVHPTRDLPRDYQASDVCVQASREEGLGFSPLEALACEVPVVATQVGGLTETVRDGETGWTYPVGDIRSLAACIASALDDKEEAARRAQEGRKLVQRQYERTKVFQDFVSLMAT